MVCEISQVFLLCRNDSKLAMQLLEQYIPLTSISLVQSEVQVLNYEPSYMGHPIILNGTPQIDPELTAEA